jgi:hypothetical protein
VYAISVVILGGGGDDDDDDDGSSMIGPSRNTCPLCSWIYEN